MHAWGTSVANESDQTLRENRKSYGQEAILELLKKHAYSQLLRGGELPSQNATEGLEKVLIVSRTSAPQLEKLLIENNFRLVEKNPDFIVCHGGDGTILFSERKFPEVPKLVVKLTSICRKCDYTFRDVESILPKIRVGKFSILKARKLETEFNNEKLVGLNEIQVRAKLPTTALRFSVNLKEMELSNLIGDGVIVATPFGSTGYYKSTGGKQFTKGIGISFNNLHNRKIESLVVSESSVIKVRVDRGPAWVLADNFEKSLELEDNDVSVIKRSKSVANFIYVQ